MEFAGFSLELLLLLFATGIVAGLLDTLAGGGGLIAMPALLLSGVSPLAALGTNKLQGSMGTAVATFMMFKHKKIQWSDTRGLMLYAFVGASIGSVVVQYVDSQVLSIIIPVVLLVIALYFLALPLLKSRLSALKMSHKPYRNGVVPSIGFYDGFFGPGTGSFFAMAGVLCRGQEMLASTAVAKALNFSTNLASLVIFIFAGKIVWLLGLLMMLGQAIGAWLGAHCLFRINPWYLRGIVVSMCFGMLFKYCLSMGWI